MRCSLQTLAIFGAIATVNAVPVMKRQTAQQTDWSSLWNSQLKSMESVQSAMGKANPTGAAGGGYQPPPQVSAQATAPAYQPQPPAYSAPSAPSVTTALAPPASYTSSPSTETTTAAGSGSSGGSAPPTGGSGATVSNQEAFTSGAACHDPTAQPPSQPASDSYQCFGNDYPSQDTWADFESLWSMNQKLLSVACTNLGMGADNTPDQSQAIHDGIMTVSAESFVDPRYIMAIMMQESHGCVNVGTTSNGVTNPGLMQSHAGVSFNAADATNSITQMIRDGVQGTSSGDGLVQLLNAHGDPWKAARAYNSGSIAPSGDLNDGNGATASYVMDVANRLKGWSMTPGTSPQCGGESA